MAEGARLESVFTGNRNVGSNPTPSANVCEQAIVLVRIFWSASNSAPITAPMTKLGVAEWSV